MKRRPRRVLGACLACLIGSAIWSSAASARWSSTFDVSGGLSGSAPEVAFDSSGNAFAWWESGTFASMAVAPPESAFGTPFRPNDPGRSIIEIDLDFDSAGNSVVVWVNDLNQIKAARRSPGPTGTFGPTQTVASGVDAFQIDVNPQGAALLTWVGPGLDKLQAAYSAPGAANEAPTFATQQLADQSSLASTPFGILDPRGRRRPPR